MTEQPFNADEITTNWDGMIPIQKKPVIVHACQMNFPEGFSVTTHHGVAIGDPGDYLMIGIDGEKYPIKKDLFERTYEKIDSENQPTTEVIRLGISNDWQVLTIYGDIYRHAIFTGPNAKELAEEYAEFKKLGSAIRAIR